MGSRASSEHLMDPPLHYSLRSWIYLEPYAAGISLRQELKLPVLGADAALDMCGALTPHKKLANALNRRNAV